MAGIRRSNAPDIKQGVLYYSLRKSMQVNTSGKYSDTSSIDMSGMNSPIVFIGETGGIPVSVSYSESKCEVFANSQAGVQIYIFDAWRAPASSGSVGIRLRDSEGVTFDTGWFLLDAEVRKYTPPDLGKRVSIGGGRAACIPFPSTVFTDKRKYYSGAEDSGGRLMQEAVVVNGSSVSVEFILGVRSFYDTPAADSSRLGAREDMLSGGNGNIWVISDQNLPSNFN